MLSLTEIRDAFAEEDESAGGFTSDATPLQHMPDHHKRQNPVSPRLAQEAPVVRKETLRKTVERDTGRRRPESRGGGIDLGKIVYQVLVFACALALHFAVSKYLLAYFDNNFVSPVNQTIITFIYPCMLVLLTWLVRKHWCH
jgi:hypothetical protein